MKLSFVLIATFLAFSLGCSTSPQLQPLPAYVATSPVRTFAEINYGFRVNKPAFSSVLEKANSPSGRIIIGLTINPSGLVSETHLVESSFENALNIEILKLVNGINFGAREVPAYIVADYPIYYIHPN